MFDSIARRYDVLNTVLSLGRDRRWRRFAVGASGLGPGGRGLDVACGTGMLALEQARAVGPRGLVVGLDFSGEMLAVARRRLAPLPQVRLVCGDALALPFPDDTFDAATMGFALRNVADVPRAVAEMARVVRPGGRVVTLELTVPRTPLFRRAYLVYFRHLLPLLGRLGAGCGGPYRYLPASVLAFHAPEEVCAFFEAAGLKGVACHPLDLGIATVHVGTKG
ncbi:MAG: class I SAM-dependent methyltransferase [Firmicutes bacterium]|nr:class I SAM-dependent methyltransferase [Bacillota bacterium]